ncbi:hypothetical protein ABZZ17_05620 [Streptomyces sp. NPDC006512]|uniref:LppU/SCO3897 family protein n=1 Tax=Streptomyces sp. NPDC006512 TaxID=3154307 RepID=UPI0033A42040
MPSEEIALTLTAQQAATGVTVKVPLATGTVSLNIPPARNGDLVRARVAGEEVLIRIRVSGTPPGAAFPAATQSTPVASGTGSRTGRGGCLVALGVVAALVVGIVLLGNDGDDSDNKASTSSSSTPEPRGGNYSPTYAPAPTYMATEPAPSLSAAPAPDPTTATPDPVTPTTEAAPTPFDRGTCLNGELPDSTTAQRVTNVEEVSCSAGDAHYRVIESIPLTSDMDRCNGNPKTEYAFSYRYTINGAVVNEYVYCLVGIGSYSRG